MFFFLNRKLKKERKKFELRKKKLNNLIEKFLESVFKIKGKKKMCKEYYDLQTLLLKSDKQETMFIQV